MPRGNRTGPEGMGPMTGRAAGYCAGYSVPGYANLEPRGGFGGGTGRGWRHMYYATGLTGWQRGRHTDPIYTPRIPYGFPSSQAITKEQEINVLENQAEYFENTLTDMRKRLDELRSKTEKQ